jgi:hypothetical protein
MKFHLGNIVYHSKFGIGEIQKLYEESSTVSFDSGHISVSNEYLNSMDIKPTKHFWPLIKDRKLESKYFKKDVYYNSHLAEPGVPPKVGVFGFVGYKTGVYGLLDSERIEILKCVFYNELPNVDSKKYMSLWGDPNSDERFGQMKASILDPARYPGYSRLAGMHRYGDVRTMERLIYDKGHMPLTKKY